jgi:DNA-binding CsgD family transcriptional regulator
VESLARATIEEPGAPPGPLASAHQILAWGGVYRGDLREADAEVACARELLVGVTDPGARSDLLTIWALVDFLQGRPFAYLIEEAVALEDLGDPAAPADSATIYSGARVTHGLALLWAGDLTAARDRLEGELDRFEGLGRYVARDEVLCYLAHLDCRTGRWTEARQRVEESLDIGEESGHRRGRGQNIVPRAWLSALTGDLEAARRDAEEGLALSLGFHDRLAAANAHGVLGLVELSTGRPDLAIPHLQEVCAFLATAGTTEPGMAPFVADAVEALVAAGRLAEARAVVDDDRLMGRRSRDPLSRVTAVRGAAALCAAEGDLAGAATMLAEVLSGDELRLLPFERGRTLLVAGEVERRARRRPRARRLIVEARAVFDELGAPRWRERADAELQRVTGIAAEGRGGGVGPQVVPLSATETLVAELVAQGLTNREVADRLFVSVKTVEANLSRVYRKLALRSRADLVRRLAVEVEDARP